MAEHRRRRADYTTVNDHAAISADEPSVAEASIPPRLFMTSDVRAATGISRTHLDFYIREDLVRPVARTESGYLLFDQREVSLLRKIVDARRQGVALRDIREQIGR
ncbi:MAG: MerR family transcriptional regulator [Thermomicrobiales bacterium]